MTLSSGNEAWRPIRFEGVELPPSLMAISILILVDDFTEKTGDWIWKLPHCQGVRKSGSSRWCRDSAREIMKYLMENRGDVLAMIRERLQPHGLEPEQTFEEWMESLLKIAVIAEGMEGYCHWIAEMPEPLSAPDPF